MNKEKILRTLDSGFFMDHREQEETAALIRDMQSNIDFLLRTNDFYSKQIDMDRDAIAGAMRLVKSLNEKISDAVGHLERGTALDVLTAIRILKCE